MWISHQARETFEERHRTFATHPSTSMDSNDTSLDITDTLEAVCLVSGKASFSSVYWLFQWGLICSIRPGLKSHLRVIGMQYSIMDQQD